MNDSNDSDDELHPSLSFGNAAQSLVLLRVRRRPDVQMLNIRLFLLKVLDFPHKIRRSRRL